MTNINISSFDIQNFLDKFDTDDTILTCKDGREQVAEFCLISEQNGFESILNLISVLFSTSEILTSDILNFCTSFIDENFKEKNWYWHLRRALLIANNPSIPTSKKIFYRKKFTDTQFQSLCADLEQFISNRPPIDFLLAGIEIEEPSALDKDIIDYLFSSRHYLEKDASYRNWLSKYCGFFSRKFQESLYWKRNEALSNKYRELLIASIVWGVNQAYAFSKTNANSKKIRVCDLPFNLKEISEASRHESIDVNVKIQILLALEEPISTARLEYEINFGAAQSVDSVPPRVFYEPVDLCTNYPASIVKTFQSWDDMNRLVQKHPIFFERDFFANEDAIKNLSALHESNPKQTQCFVKKYLNHFLRMYGWDLCFNHEDYFNGNKTPSASFGFLQQVLSKQDDAIPLILNLPETRDFIGKAIALSLIQTPAANRAIWDLYKSPYRSKDIVFNLAMLIDNDENFEFEEFYQLALSDEGIAYKFMQVGSQRFQYYLEYKPEMVRELFKKYPEIITYIKMKPVVLNAVFANQENLIKYIPSEDDSAIYAFFYDKYPPCT